MNIISIPLKKEFEIFFNNWESKKLPRNVYKRFVEENSISQVIGKLNLNNPIPVK